MSPDSNVDAIVIGSGPNGLAAAITLAQKGLSVVVYEAKPTIGGGTRTEELTLPGFLHDVCSSVHPMAASSSFFRQLNFEQFGLRWIEPEIALAHPFENEEPALITGTLDDNLQQFGADASAVRGLIGGVTKSWEIISKQVLDPGQLPTPLLTMARFGWNAIQPVSRTIRRFRTEKARAVFAGFAAHSILPMERWASSAIGIVLWATCYAVGWPFAAGGSAAIAAALAKSFENLGGTIITDRQITKLAELPKARAILCDITPRQFLVMAGHRVESSERRKLEKFRSGPGVFKLDWALDGPIPWNAAACGRAGTVHLGNTFEEIAKSERAAWAGDHVERPFVLLAQPSLFDPTRAPAGKHTAWAYCHVPFGSTVNMTERIESQIERFATGFRKRILARSVLFPADLERHNPNLAGGDISGGAMDIGQLFFRPTRSRYSTSLPNVFLCSASTPPGPGVHGMCGHLAALRALRKCF